MLRHEKESKLHAENLAKRTSAAGLKDAANPSSAAGAGEASSSQQYRDRASERREVHGTINMSALAAAGIRLNEDLPSSGDKMRKCDTDDTNADNYTKYAPPSLTAAAVPALRDDVDNPGQPHSTMNM